jgi:3-dehydroquinate synthase
MQMPELVFTKTISESLKQYCSLNHIKNAVVLCDSNTKVHCLPILSEFNFQVIECPAGEQSKSFEQVSFIVNQLLALNADRQTHLINLGGGMVSDLGGFVASIYKRGIPFINIPTSLLGMVDAGIGGKTGIDFLNYKNIIGAFNHAKAIFISSEFLHTLPNEEYVSAWSEIIKTATVANLELFQTIEDNAEIDEIIKQCALTKTKLVEMDFRDLNIRQLLNFGHTIGHALESYQLEINTPIHHGFAVAYGMLTELKIALHLNNISKDEFKRIAALIKTKVEYEIEEDGLFHSYSKYLLGDKKNNDSNISFSLPKSIGNGQYQCKVSMDQLKNWKIEGII